MRTRALILALPAAALLPASSWAVDILGWKVFEKKQTASLPAPTPAQESAASGDVKRVEAMMASGDLGDALKLARSIVKERGLTSGAGRAQFNVGRILERKGDYEDAYKAYADYLTRFPRGGDFDAAVQAQFNIAKLFLDGRKKKVLGVPISPSFNKANEMFTGIVQRAPYHRLAPTAQFNAGLALEKAGKPTEALVAYQELLARYPGDAVADDAQYQIGYIQLRETKDGSYDQNARNRAKEAFEDFVARYPESEKASQAKENIKTLGNTDVKGTMEVAQYYDKVKQYKAAVIYYKEVIRVAPGTAESGEARKRIDALKGIVGADALQAGPARPLSGAEAFARRQAQSRVDVASRPDFTGPAVPLPPLPTDPARPRFRVPGGALDPALPVGDPLLGGPGGLELPPLPPEKKPEEKPAEPAPEKPADDAGKKAE